MTYIITIYVYNIFGVVTGVHDSYYDADIWWKQTQPDIECVYNNIITYHTG